jgi:hypothetical protein
LYFVKVYRECRHIQIKKDKVKGEMEAVKTPLDSTMLKLHNLSHGVNFMPQLPVLDDHLGIDQLMHHGM